MKLDFLDNMTTEENVVLVGEIWDDIEKDYLKISSAQKDELDRRIERGEAKFYTVDEVFEEIRSKRKEK